MTNDHDGRLWLVVGTDSNFEGTTTVYVQLIPVRLAPITSLRGVRRQIRRNRSSSIVDFPCDVKKR